jgi:hypothetical protein
LSRKTRRALADLVAFPVDAIIGGNVVEVTTRSEFIAEYDHIVTQKVQDTVMQQDVDDLFVNYEGVMVARGGIWFSGVCPTASCDSYEIKIVGFFPFYK